MSTTWPRATEPPATALPPASTRPGRRGPRLSGGHLLLLVAALAAGLANYAVLTSDDTVPVVVAADDLVPGEVLTGADLRVVAIGVGDAASSGLVPAADLDALVGGVATAEVPSGAVLRPGDVRPAAATAGLRRMSLPIDRVRAVAGAVAVGDRVDVLATTGGRSVWLLGDVGVLAVGGGDGGPFGDVGGSFSLTVAVDADAAACLATALATTELTVVLSTGTAPVVADGCDEITRVAPVVQP